MVTKWHKMVVGSILRDPERILDAEILNENDFKDPQNKFIFDTWVAIKVAQAQNALNIDTVDAILCASYKEVDGAGNYEHTGRLVELIASAASDLPTFKAAVENVVDGSMYEELDRFSAYVAMASRAKAVKPLILIDDFMQKLYSIRRTDDDGMMIGDMFPGLKARIIDIRSGNTDKYWSPKMPGVSSIVKFAAENDFVLYAGRPGTGKSSMQRFDALKTVEAGQHVITFEGDGGRGSYAMYAAAYVSGIPSDKFENPKKMTDEDLQKFFDAEAYIATLPWRIIETYKLGYSNQGDKIISIVKKHNLTAKVSVVQVDQLQNIVSQANNEIIDATTYSLLYAAQALPIPIVLSHQLNKPSEDSKKRGKPSADDLHYGGDRAAKRVFIPRVVEVNLDEALRFRQNMSRTGKLPEDKADYRVQILQMHCTKNSNNMQGALGEVAWDRAVNQYYPLVYGWRSKHGDEIYG